MEVTQDITRLREVTALCLQGGAAVNAQRQPFNRTPLHDLLSVLNIPLGFDPFWRHRDSAEAVSRQQDAFDDALIRYRVQYDGASRIDGVIVSVSVIG